MAKYRNKPIIIDAIQWDGTTANQIFKFVGDSLLITECGAPCETNFDRYKFKIKTLEGDMEVSPYDFIIKGVNNEFYPCKSDVFEKTYELVEN